MKENNLHTMLNELKTKVKESSGKIAEGELINLITLIARAELELKKNGSGDPEIFEKEIMKFV